MGYAVLHSSKGSGSGGGLGNHIDRIKGMEHTFKHSDQKRQHLNVNYPVDKNRHKMSIPEAIKDRIKEGYNGKRKIRTDAKKYMTTVLTGSHKDMKAIFQDENKKNDWIMANRKFIEDEFGKENLVRFTLHMDEKTPHIHAVTIPLTKDGRLSAKEVMGNKSQLQKRQDRYANAMERFELERGIRGTGREHEDAKRYYGRLAKADEEIKENSDLSVKKSFLWADLGIDKDKTIEAYKNSLEVFKTGYVDLENQLEREKKNKIEIIERENKLKYKIKTIDRLLKDSIRGKWKHYSSDEFEKDEIESNVKNELGEKWENHFKNIPKGLEGANDKDIKNYVYGKVDKLEKHLTKEELELLRSSKTVKNYQTKLQEERDRYEQKDERKSRGRKL